MTSYDEPDLARIARLIEAGARVGISPRAGEDPATFAYRIADAGRVRRRALGIAARLAVTAALAAFGIASF